MAPMLREATFDWFLSIRASVAQRISAKLVLKQAKVYFKMMVGEMARTGVFANMPILDSQWLRRWKKEHGISFKKPNKRYKCKRSTLRGRLRAMWLTNVRFRALAQCCLQIDMPMYGFDQKGIFMNEAGSKNIGSLSLDGCDHVALKENHAATRCRVSLMTTVVSTKWLLDSFEHGPPLEMMFKGTERIISPLEQPDNCNLSRP